MATNHKFESMMKMAQANTAERETSKKETETVEKPVPTSKNTEENQNSQKTVSSNDTLSDTANGKKQGRGEAPAQRPSAEKGCKPGYSRHGYVIPLTMIEQVSNMAKYFGYTESALCEMLLQKGIDEVISKHGKECILEKKQPQLF